MPIPFSTADLIQLGAILCAAGAEDILPRFGKLQQHQIREKTSAFDVVTEADEAAERARARLDGIEADTSTLREIVDSLAVRTA